MGITTIFGAKLRNFWRAERKRKFCAPKTREKKKRGGGGEEQEEPRKEQAKDAARILLQDG